MVDIRNFIIHRYLNLHDIIDATKITYPYNPENAPIKNPEYHMDVHEFFNLTILAMRNVRNLIFSLSFFVEEKEKAKVKNSNEIIPTIEWEINWDSNPELKKIADDFAQELTDALQKCKTEIITALEEGKYTKKKK